jgi:hypothetical protein
VVKHYQWIIRHDYLPRICDPSVVEDVFNNGRRGFEAWAPLMAVPTMPIEFSVGAFRLGHSMIRRAYDWNALISEREATLDALFEFSAGSGTLGRGERLPSSWIPDLRRLYDFVGETGRPDLAPQGPINRAMRIDTTLINPLSLTAATVDPRANLAFRNLVRARMVKLASGQQMARFLKGRGMKQKPLTRTQIEQGNDGAQLDRLTAKQRGALAKETPLWFYVLREAELNGGRLTGVGARIVAETFHRAMEGSEFSIVRDPGFRPSLGPDDTTFRMVDLLLTAFEGKSSLLAPVGEQASKPTPLAAG